MIPFFLPHAVTAAIVAAYLTGQPWAFALPTWAFLAGLAVDLVVVSVPAPLAARATRTTWRVLLHTWAPLHVAALLCGLHAASALPEGSETFWPQLFAIAVGLGMIGGTLGGSLAHEFMHVPRTSERVIGTALMCLTTYGHFAIAHVAGHHRLVGTPADPATARRGETLYVFLARSFAGGVRLAWRAERHRLARRGRSPVSTGNRLLQVFAFEALLYVAIYAAAGTAGVVLFALQSLIGASLLEVMNYVMHYGLLRRRLPSGRYEPVRPACSWNTQRPATTYLLCGIGLHSQHHCRPSKPFPRLSVPASAPELPGGLFAMFVLAWFPPLWWRVMDPLVDLWMRPPRSVAGAVGEGGR